MAKKARDTKELVAGDIVKFKNVNRILLKRMEMSTGVEMYYIFHPERGVYSAYREELTYVDHLDEWDNLLKGFDFICLNKTA